ncbi:hypothetical protein BH24GEM1_BH24GEM1_10140 [soil metagenome]
MIIGNSWQPTWTEAGASRGRRQISHIPQPDASVAVISNALAEALRDRYLLERVLGRGGMATVYLAGDLKHERDVALKVLNDDVAASLGPERFQREIKLAARLHHPHVLSVYDSGEDAGRLWFAMPYVRGESLRDRLRREGILPIEEALRITRQAAQALSYAHKEGVIHRDVKPENLLLTGDGSTQVADFGIARATRLAVLPFENLGDSSDAYFADGIADEVRGKLAALSGLEVIARSSSSRYRETGKSPGEIARDLDVKYLLSGTVRWEKRPGQVTRVRVSPELVDARSGATRWQRSFDAAITDVFEIQGEIAGDVASALNLALAEPDRRGLAARPTRSLEAYTLYLHGKDLRAGEVAPEALRAAEAAFRRAVEIDSAFANAWAELAMRSGSAACAATTRSRHVARWSGPPSWPRSRPTPGERGAATPTWCEATRRRRWRSTGPPSARRPAEATFSNRRPSPRWTWGSGPRPWPIWSTRPA